MSGVYFLERATSLIVALVVLGAVVVWWTTPAVLEPLTTLELEPLTIAGHRVTIGDVQGRVALINLWGVWCPPCRAEFPDIVHVHRAFANRPDFRLFAVSCGAGGDDDFDSVRQSTTQFLGEQNTSHFPTYFDRDGHTRAALSSIGAFRNSYPTTVVIDRKGMVRGKWVGYRSGAEVEMSSLIERLLAE
jgi:thiol-disulfide isomerase/thioredoxin